MDLPPPPTHQQTIEAVMACGIPAAHIRITYQDLLQSDVVEVSDAGESTEAKWLCLLDAVHPYYILELADADQRTGYYQVAHREERKKARAEALAWLGERDMLDKVPLYRADHGVQQFAKAVEEACSLGPGSALEVFGETLLMVRPEFLQISMGNGDNEKMTCLMHVIAASNAEEQGIGFGFVGNEAEPVNGTAE